MVRLQLALFIAFALCLSGVVAQDTPKPDANDLITAELKRAKEEFQSGAEKANEKLLTAFSIEQKKLEQNTKLKVDQQIKLIEQLSEEQKAFEADTTRLPASSVMKLALNEYLAKTAVAKKKCEEAFSKAAENYRSKKDFAAAKSVLTELDAFKENSLSLALAPTNDPASKLIAGRESLTRAIANTKWSYPEGSPNTLTLKSDGTAVMNNADAKPTWAAFDENRVIMHFPASNDYDILVFSPDRKSVAQDWLGKPSGRSNVKGRRVDKK